MGIKALARLTSGNTSVTKYDFRERSPKALGDLSGISLPRITSKSWASTSSLPDYSLLARVVACSDLAWSCINLVSSTAAQAALKVKKKTKSGIFYEPSHELQKTLDFPNSSMTQFDLIQSYVSHQLLFGTVGLILLREDMTSMCPECEVSGEEECPHKLLYDSASPIRQIMPIHPDNIQPSEKRGFFWYTPNGLSGTRYLVHPNNILTDPFYNTEVGWYGVSPTQLVMRWLNLDKTMTDQVTGFFENGAIPSLIVTLKPTASGQSYEEDPETILSHLKQNWMNKFSAKGTEAKSPAFVYGDIQVDRLQEHVDEVIADNLYKEIKRRVCKTYGVPVSFYDAEATPDAERTFYNQSISPILTRFQSKVSNLILPSYNDPSLELSWDLSNLGVAAFLLKEQRRNLENLWTAGAVTRNEFRSSVGLDPIEGELGNDLYRVTVMSDGKGNNQSQIPASNNSSNVRDAELDNNLIVARTRRERTEDLELNS